MLNKIIIGAPFGNYFQFSGTTRTLGTFTLRRRGGIFHRLWKVVSTVRYLPRFRSWVNRLGLPNPGIYSLKTVPDGAIVSVCGFSADEWGTLLNVVEDHGGKCVELNVSCPNVDEVAEMPSLRFSGTVIAKLPPVGYGEVGARLYDKGVRYFHLCNTFPTPRGGVSGQFLKSYSIRAVRWFRHKYGNEVRLIGGGGVYSLTDAKHYFDAGADHVSIASMLFNPFNWWRIGHMVECGH